MLPAIYIALTTFVAMFSSLNVTISLISYPPQQLLLSASSALDALAAALTSLEGLAYTSTAFCECNSCCDPFVLEPYDGRIDYSHSSMVSVPDTIVTVTASVPTSTLTSTATVTSTSMVTSLITSTVTVTAVSAAPTVVENALISTPAFIKPTSDTFTSVSLVLVAVFAFVVSISHGRFARSLRPESPAAESIDPQDPIKTFFAILSDDPTVTELEQVYPSELEFVGYTDDLSDPDAMYSRSFGVSTGVLTVFYVPNDMPRPWATAIRVPDVIDIQIDRGELEGIPVPVVTPSSSVNISTSFVDDASTLSSISPVIINAQPASAPTPCSKSHLPSPSPTPSPSSSPWNGGAGVTGTAPPVTPTLSRQGVAVLVDSPLDSPPSAPHTIRLDVTESYVPGQAYESVPLDVIVQGTVRGEYEDVLTNIGVAPEGTSENAHSLVASVATPDDSLSITDQLHGDASLLRDTLPIASSTSAMDALDLPSHNSSSIAINSNLRGDRSLFSVSPPSMRSSHDTPADTLPRSSTLNSLAQMSSELAPGQELLLAESPPSILSFSPSSCSTPMTNTELRREPQGNKRFSAEPRARRQTTSTPVTMPSPTPSSSLLCTADHPLAYKGDWQSEPGYTRKLQARIATERHLPLDHPSVTEEIASIHARFPPLISPSKPSTILVSMSTSELSDSSISGLSGSSLPSSPHLPPPSPSDIDRAGKDGSDEDVFGARGSRPCTTARHSFLPHAGSRRPPRRNPLS